MDDGDDARYASLLVRCQLQKSSLFSGLDSTPNKETPDHITSKRRGIGAVDRHVEVAVAVGVAVHWDRQSGVHSTPPYSINIRELMLVNGIQSTDDRRLTIRQR